MIFPNIDMESFFGSSEAPPEPEAACAECGIPSFDLIQICGGIEICPECLAVPFMDMEVA